jgi:Zn-dependent M32 family carboxypeptidase
MKLKLKSPENIDYLNPTNDDRLQSYLDEIIKLENEYMSYLRNEKNHCDYIINWYEHNIQLKWDNVKFYKEYFIKK